MSAELGTEATPLLGDTATTPKTTTTTTTTPLPKFQLFVAYLLRIVEPVANSVIYPTINQMLVDLGAASGPETVGYASGLVGWLLSDGMNTLLMSGFDQLEATISIAHFMTSFYWGMLSDKFGRKPLLILVNRVPSVQSRQLKVEQGCIGSACAALLFGFSRSFAMVVVARFMLGALNGNVVSLKAVV